MNTYHKIQTVYFRDLDNNNKTLLEGKWSHPEFEYLKDLQWDCTEKIDGTNIRVIWDGNKPVFKGKTDNAQIPSTLVAKLYNLFDIEKLRRVFPYAENPQPVCLYGEGYGKKIQKGGNYIPDDVNFILFDIKIGPWWLQRNSIVEIANKLQIQTVPLIGTMTLTEAIEYVRQGFTSTISENTEYLAEGLICKPTLELFGRAGRRIITKIKHVDFQKN